MMTKNVPGSCCPPMFKTVFSSGKYNAVPLFLGLTLNLALRLRSVNLPTSAFRCLTCHRWPCMLLNVRCTVDSNPPTLSLPFDIVRAKPFSQHPPASINPTTPFTTFSGAFLRPKPAIGSVLLQYPLPRFVVYISSTSSVSRRPSRREINNWIGASGKFDAVQRLCPSTRDPREWCNFRLVVRNALFHIRNDPHKNLDKHLSRL
jgi:hypothetical protein